MFSLSGDLFLLHGEAQVPGPARAQGERPSNTGSLIGGTASDGTTKHPTCLTSTVDHIYNMYIMF